MMESALRRQLVPETALASWVRNIQASVWNALAPRKDFSKEKGLTVRWQSLQMILNCSMNIVITECDFSSLAESENEKSDWVNIIFKPLDDTIVGPPDVKVKSESGSLHVDFTGPLAVQESHVWPLNKYYGSWVYRVLYWKKGNSEEVITTDSKYNSEILSGLDPWTIYCLQVQAVIPEWNKTGKLSEEFCDMTTANVYGGRGSFLAQM
uniref:Fibronectin type-III domain-containing protein n=1 Tax=Chelonoidis abingdonii TaxID=106734 RepID=A0A8C0GFX3_CHEAB